MQIREGQQRINNNTQQAIIEFIFDDYIIYVFQGTLSQYDIIIKYRKDGTRIRTPKHIHWAVDILMKMQGNEELTRRYLMAIQQCWNSCRPLENNDYNTLKSLILDGEENIEISQYEPLNDFGEYDVEFLYVLMKLLAVQEKTNRFDAYMFGNIIAELLEVEGIFSKLCLLLALMGEGSFKMIHKSITKWEPEDFELEMTSVWSFPKRGDWATHDAKWRGNWSPYIPRNILLRYSKEGDMVLDQFAGGGTTLVEAKLLNRNIIGLDVNDEALKRCREKVNFEYEGANGKVYIRKGDARNLKGIPNEGIDLICTHPPYADIIHYSENQDIPADLSNFKVDGFLKQMQAVADESYRVLKKGKFCAVLMGDTRQKGHVIPLSFKTMQVFENAGFKLKEIIMKEQHNCRATGYWKTNSIKYNFLLLAHEYLFVFKKDK